MEFKNIKSIIPTFPNFETVTDISIEGDKLPEFITDMHLTDPTSGEFSFTTEVDSELFKKITGVDLALKPGNFSFEFAKPYKVQKRRHRTKRINKKWAKEYGYCTKFHRIEAKEFSVTHIENGLDEIEFYGEYINGKSL